MQIAIDCAGFLPAKADKLRRAMATFRRAGTIHKLKDDFINGMVGNGYEREFAERCFKQIEGFGEYGFPESHAASFAILVYVSSWVKHYYPEVFAAALLNSQPMGFYAPAQLVRDAREHGVEVRPPDVNASDWDCTLEKPSQNNRCALRLGLRQVTGLSEDDVKRMVERRTEPYRDPADLWRRSGLTKRQIVALARADAFASLGLIAPRRAVGGARLLRCVAAAARRPGRSCATSNPRSALPTLTLGEQVVDDYGRSRCRCAPIRWRCCGRASPSAACRRSEVLRRPRRTATDSSWPAWSWCASGRAPPRAWCSSPSRTSTASPTSWSGPRYSRPIAASSWARACSACAATCSARAW